MRPHHTVELLKEFLALPKRPLVNDAGDELDKRAYAFIEVAHERLSEAITFETPQPEQIPDAIQAFAIDLAAHDLVRLPFPSCFFWTRGEPQAVLAFEAPEAPCGFQVILIESDPDSPGAPPVPTLLGTFIQQPTGKAEEKAWSVGVYVAAQKGKADAADARVGGWALMRTMVACALLMSRSTSTTTEPAPARLNTARARKGKPPIGEVRTITIRGAAQGTARSSCEGAGDRASPIMHWRRGHLRTLRSERFVEGQGRGRVLPIAPMLVNGAEGVDLPPPKEYRIA